MTLFSIADLVAAGKEFGIFDFYLPFVIIFAMIYGLLTKSEIFGKPDTRFVRNINLMIALAVGLFVMAYTPVGITLATFFSNLFTGTLVVLATILSLLLILTLLLKAVNVEMKLTKFVWLVVLIVIGIVISMYISSGGMAFFPGAIPGMPEIPAVIFPGLTAQDLAIIILVVFTGLVIWWMTKGEGKKEKIRYVGVPIRE